MPKYGLLLVAILVSGAAFAQGSDTQGDIEIITIGPDPFPGDGATGEPVQVSTSDVQVGCATELTVFSDNLQRIEEKPASERTVLVREQVRAINRFIVKQKVVRQELTLGQLTSMLAQLGYIGAADAWAVPYVKEAKARGLIVGKTPGYSVADKSCKAPVNRQDAAVAFLRHDKNKGAHPEAFGEHNRDENAHSALFASIRRQARLGSWAFWLLMALLLILLLSFLFGPSLRRAFANGANAGQAAVGGNCPSSGFRNNADRGNRRWGDHVARYATFPPDEVI